MFASSATSADRRLKPQTWDEGGVGRVPSFWGLQERRFQVSRPASGGCQLSLKMFFLLHPEGRNCFTQFRLRPHMASPCPCSEPPHPWQPGHRKMPGDQEGAQLPSRYGGQAGQAGWAPPACVPFCSHLQKLRLRSGNRQPVLSQAVDRPPLWWAAEQDDLRP